MGVPPVMSGRAGRPSHFQEWKLFNSHSLSADESGGLATNCFRSFVSCLLPEGTGVNFRLESFMSYN